MLKNSLWDSWSFFKIHYIALSLIILPIVVPLELLSVVNAYFITNTGLASTAEYILMIAGYLLYPIYAVGVVFYIASAISGNSIDTKKSRKLGTTFWLPYLILSIFVTVVVILGLFLFVLPGVIFAVRLAFSEFDLLLNQSRAIDAMKNSWYATKDYMLLIFIGYLIITVVLYVPYYLIASLMDKTSVSYWLLDTASGIAYSVLGTLYTIFAFRVYLFAKQRNDQSLTTDTP